MAIITDEPGISITVICQGATLQEYNDDSAEPTPGCVTKYVEATSGAKFGVPHQYNAKFQHHDSFVELNLYLDGKKFGHMHAKRKGMKLDKIQTWDYSRTTVGDRVFHQPFMFSELKITEGQADESLFNKLGELGQITVKCFRAEQTPVHSFALHEPPSPARRRQRKPVFSSIDKTRKPLAELRDPLTSEEAAKIVANKKYSKAAFNQDEIAEKNLKGRAISHRAQLGPPEEQPCRNKARSYRWKRLDDESFATFTFKYRSRAALQALHVIPRTPSPAPVVPLEDRPIEELTADEMRELLLRQRDSAGEAKVKQEIKRERHAAHNGEDSEVEMVDTRPTKKARASAGAETPVVDLCGDDD